MAEQVKWSEAEITRLIELRKTGMFPSAIGKEMNRSIDSIRHKLKWLREQGIEGAFALVPTTVEGVKKEEERQAKEKAAKESKPLRKKEPDPSHASYPPLEYCPVHHCLVSNWPDHIARLGGCTRPMTAERAL